jgi:hypothetical protein
MPTELADGLGLRGVLLKKVKVSSLKVKAVRVKLNLAYPSPLTFSRFAPKRVVPPLRIVCSLHLALMTRTSAGLG